jgi:hypothetical protein
MLSQMALAAGTSFAATNARKKPMLLALRKKRPSATRCLSNKRCLPSDAMTSLADKKLDHDIMKARDDKFERYRQCLKNKVVCEAPSLEPSLCVVLVVP